MPSPAASTPFDQSRYQVRLDWGLAGLRRAAPAEVVVVVDVLRFSSTVSARVAAGEAVPLDEAAHAVSRNGAAIAAAASDSVVLLGCLRNAAAVADAVLDEQRRRGARTSIAVIAAGELAGPDEASDLRFAVEDLLGAGAVVDALSRLGIDHTSPEAAAACESFRGLGGAVRHLLTASGSGQELLERGLRDDALAAAQIDVDGVAPVLRDGVFTGA
ncbi:2-phosphosulfolactate phosphatase [Microbacterium sp. cf332]|uniref:2-phosphosulfolactate phosphatase n=1 Tax=Microbacterium sp. cf332 TaxID=1761804 RepID=UPI000890C44C|nr:2-phosphosulfolactate phosphatase [Microbacterium sp. cf332]SDQ45926.1 2-phosphosulpholactate phosphatase [Microbacterium sp. cf332]